MPQEQTRDDARFREAAALFTQQRYEEAMPLLEQASQAGDGQAQNLLGIMYLNGIGIELDTHKSFELFEAAAAGGLKEGHYNLSNMLFNGAGAPRDERSARRHLLAAAEAGHRPALRALGFMYHLMGDSGEWPELSTRAFEQAALMGDPLSKYNLGLRLWQGHGAAPDPARAAGWFAAAAQDKVELAMTRLQALGAAHPGLAPSPPSPPAAPPSAQAWPGWEHPRLQMPEPSNGLGFLSEFNGTLDGYLCDHLINVGSPQLAPAAVLDPEGGHARSVIRTSYNTYFKLSMYDAITASIWARFSLLAGLPAEHAEPLVVQRYQVGQEYKRHRDYFTDSTHTSQRMVTVFAYLNDVEAGGNTAFPILGVSVRPERGKAVRFINCRPGGKPDPDTLHAGLPVIRGEKWLATLWFWDRPFDWFS
jgi:prolyl 4-hydroxylase